MTAIVAGGAVWTSVMAAEGALEMAPVAAWLWLTVPFTTRRGTTRPRGTSARS
jgi:hypothetical protein